MTKTLSTNRHQKLIKLLIEKREAANITQTELATVLGQYQSYVARLESGQRRVDVIEYIELSNVLDFDPLETLSDIVSCEE